MKHVNAPHDLYCSTVRYVQISSTHRLPISRLNFRAGTPISPRQLNRYVRSDLCIVPYQRYIYITVRQGVSTSTFQLSIALKGYSLARTSLAWPPSPSPKETASTLSLQPRFSLRLRGPAQSPDPSPPRPSHPVPESAQQITFPI